MKQFLTIVFLLAASCVSAQNRDMMCDTVPSSIPNPDDVYSSAGLQVLPEFPGGNNTFGTYFISKFNTKKIKDIKDQPSVRVIVSFVIEKDGSASNIKILRSGSNDVSEQVIKILSEMPKWSPGIQNGQPVRSNMALPITINLTE